MHDVPLSLSSHENASGYYRLSAFFLAKIIGNLIPNKILPSIGFAVISYFMMGVCACACWCEYDYRVHTVCSFPLLRTLLTKNQLTSSALIDVYMHCESVLLGSVSAVC